MPLFEVQISYRIEGYNYEQVEAETAEAAERIIQEKYEMEDGSNYHAEDTYFQPDLNLCNCIEIELCQASLVKESR